MASGNAIKKRSAGILTGIIRSIWMASGRKKRNLHGFHADDISGSGGFSEQAAPAHAQAVCFDHYEFRLSREK